MCDIVGITGKAPPVRAGQVSMYVLWDWGSHLIAYLNRLSTTVAQPTQAQHVHRNLSAFGGESVPPGVGDAVALDPDLSAAHPQGLALRRGETLAERLIPLTQVALHAVF